MDGSEAVQTFLGKSKDSPSYAVIAKAIREYFKGDEEKMRVPWSRQMAEIIDSGFLDGVLAQGEKLIKRNQALIQDSEKLARELNREIAWQKEQLKRILREKDEAQEQLKEIKETIETEEPDKVLASAKRAYIWILYRTKNELLASKAFNSYLIGQNVNHEEYTPPKGENEHEGRTREDVRRL